MKPCQYRFLAQSVPRSDTSRLLTQIFAAKYVHSSPENLLDRCVEGQELPEYVSTEVDPECSVRGVSFGLRVRLESFMLRSCVDNLCLWWPFSSLGGNQGKA